MPFWQNVSGSFSFTFVPSYGHHRGNSPWCLQPHGAVGCLPKCPGYHHVVPCTCAGHAVCVRGGGSPLGHLSLLCDSLFRSPRVTFVGRTYHSPVTERRAATSTVGVGRKGLAASLQQVLWGWGSCRRFESKDKNVWLISGKAWWVRVEKPVTQSSGRLGFPAELINWTSLPLNGGPAP